MSGVQVGPGELRQPGHVVYGGAHLFRADTAAKLGALARASFAEHAPDPGSLARALGLDTGGDGGRRAALLHARVAAKLAAEPVEDLRIDFEDGFGPRPDAEEDETADRAAAEVARAAAAGGLPRLIGIRVKAMRGPTRARAERTLDRFLRALVSAGGGTLPSPFIVTLPKVERQGEVEELVDQLDQLERSLGLAGGDVAVEIMVETPRAIIDESGTFPLLRLVRAARGRCIGAHFGTYDYTAACGVTASHQGPEHPACSFARSAMQVALAGSGVFLADGATTRLPVPVHRGESPTPAQREENRAAVHHGWKVHFDNVQASMRRGFYQSWDLHPAQLPARWAAVHDFFLAGLDDTAERLRLFVERAARATLSGAVFDDAATGQGLLHEMRRAIASGAATEEEVAARTGLTADDLRLASFAQIVARRPARA